MVITQTVEFNLTFRTAIVLIILLYSLAAHADLQVVVVEGLSGEPRYATQFSEQVDGIATAASSMTTSENVKVFRNGNFDREALVNFFGELASELTTDDRLAVFLVGHGSFDDHEYKFNVPGPDVTGNDLKTLLDAVPASMQLLVNTSSSSGAIQEELQHDGRTLILATRSGVERHATRFGGYFAAALSEPGADLDKNNSVTAAEAFQFAERQVADYYERNGQLATEHPRLEGDNAARFGLSRLDVKTISNEDARLSALQAERDALNSTIDELRLRRESMSADEYQQTLLENLLELAMLEEQIEQREAQINQ